MKLLQTLISTKLLNEVLSSSTKNVRVVDTSWFLPKANRNGRNEYMNNHIGGAVFFDIDECCDKTSKYSHMLPSTTQFEDYVGNLGISNKTHVVVYDNSNNHGFFSSQRVWWTFRVFGHTSVSILNGGFVKWKDEGLPTSSDVPTYTSQVFKAHFNSQMVKSFHQMEENLNNKSFQVVDARGAGRFNGTEPEARPEMRSGHIPGSTNIPYSNIIDPCTKEVASPENLKLMFERNNIDLQQPLVATCGSGVTACCLALAGHLIGKDIPVYDGSWTEWYQRSQPHQREPKEPVV